MFPYNDPHAMLELHHQRVAELHHEAVAFQLARSVGARHRTATWWDRVTHRRHAVRAPAVG